MLFNASRHHLGFEVLGAHGNLPHNLPALVNTLHLPYRVRIFRHRRVINRQCNRHFLFLLVSYFSPVHLLSYRVRSHAVPSRCWRCCHCWPVCGLRRWVLRLFQRFHLFSLGLGAPGVSRFLMWREGGRSWAEGWSKGLVPSFKVPRIIRHYTGSRCRRFFVTFGSFI